MKSRNRRNVKHANSGAYEFGRAIVHTLSEKTLAHTARFVSKQWRNTIDLGKLIQASRSTGSHLAAVATAAVARVMLLLAAVDPVAQRTDWFHEAVISLQDAAGRSNGMLAVMYEDILWSIGAPLRKSGTPLAPLSEMWNLPPTQSSLPVVGNASFVGECMPYLDKIRGMLTSGIQLTTKRYSGSWDQARRAQFFSRAADGEDGGMDKTSLPPLPPGVDWRILKIAKLATTVKPGDPQAAVDAFKSSTAVLARDARGEVLIRMAEWVRKAAEKVATGMEEIEKKPATVAKADLWFVRKALSGDLSPGEAQAVFASHGIGTRRWS